MKKKIPKVPKWVKALSREKLEAYCVALEALLKQETKKRKRRTA
jgi:hypothetical protein